MHDARMHLAADHRSGASELVATAAAAVRAALDEVGPTPERLAPALRRICRAQPAMASVINLSSRALLVAESAAQRGDVHELAAAHVRQAVTAFEADLATAGEAAVDHAAAMFPPTGWVATYSRSSLVENLFLTVHAARRSVRALLAEGRPLCEGRELARRLAAAGVPCWLTVDASLPLLLPQAAALFVGADTVLPTRFINKAGTYALLLAAREGNVPAYAIAPRAKFLPAEAHLLELEQRDPAEVWPDAPAGVSVRNLTFEEAPLSLLRGVITETGVLPPGEAGVAAAETKIPAALRAAWGEGPGEERG
jgi:translation initiation factor 2B subunit (eIF-2B alpha/beta/delta family)